MPKLSFHGHKCVLRGTVAVTGLVGFVIPFATGKMVADAAPSHTDPVGRSTPQSEADALRSAHWMSNVSFSIGKGSWTFKSDGLPPTKFVAPQYAVPRNPVAVSAAGARIIASASILKDQNYDYTLPVTPAYTKATTTTNQGPIGVALDGAVFYNPYEANHATVATADNFISTSGRVSASFLDDCDGHPGPNGQYHYHGLPSCLVSYATGQKVPDVEAVTSTAGSKTAAVRRATASSRKPVLLGFAFDGYAIYDNVAMNGKIVQVSALDGCNGIFSRVPGYSRGVYHYVLENIKGARADIGCYHGVVSSAYTRALQGSLGVGGAPPGGGPPSGSSGSPPPSSGGPPTSNAALQTAYTLAANPNEDKLLRAAVAVDGDDICG